MWLPSWEEINCALVGGAVVGVLNITARKPVISRLPLYAVGITSGIFVGSYLTKYVQTKSVQRDIYLMDYVRTHPEDFPELRPKKYKEILQPWDPIR